MTTVTVPTNTPNPQPSRRRCLSLSLAPRVDDPGKVDLIRVADDLGDDQTLATAVELAIRGLGADHDCEGEANAVAELVHTLQLRLDERVQHVHELLDAERSGEAVQ